MIFVIGLLSLMFITLWIDNVVLEWKLPVVFLGFFIFIRLFLVDFSMVPTSSMYPTLQRSDFLVATKYDYGFSKYTTTPFWFSSMKGRVLQFNKPQRGDICVIVIPNNKPWYSRVYDTISPFSNQKYFYVKRLIGKPGDKIQMIKGDLYINDQKIRKDFIDNYDYKEYQYDNEYGLYIAQQSKFKRYKEHLPNGATYDIIYSDFSNNKNFAEQMFIDRNLRNTKVFVVPEKHYFFMGDNRDHSNDSRLGLSFIHEDRIVAKPRIIHFSNKFPLWSNIKFFGFFTKFIVWIKSINFSRIFQDLEPEKNHHEIQ